jgi:uncharacterized integral membrane protein (TIGR00698 family)
VIGAPVLGVVLGALASRLPRRSAVLRPGVTLAAGPLLQVAVVLLGAQLSLGQVASVGAGSLPVMLGTLAACLVAAHRVGRRLGIAGDLRLLIGVGTGICGASAISAVSSTIRAKSPDVAYAISTIFLFNVAAVLAFPPLGAALHLGQHAFGLFAGTAVNDTSSVLAAADSYGAAAGHYAVVVKLTRTLMIIPICLVVAGRRGTGRGPGRRLVRVPWFLVGFVALAAANSLGAVAAAAHPPAQHAATALITVALTAVGLSTDPPALRRAGPRPLLLGLALWLTVTATSLGLQAVTSAL